MLDPGAFYAVALHSPNLRETLTEGDVRPLRPHLSHSGTGWRCRLAQMLRAVATHLDSPPVPVTRPTGAQS
jgi:hypothetical protein